MIARARAVLLLGVPLLLTAAGCGTERVPVEVLYASANSDDVLRVSVNTCQGSPELTSVTETAAAVEVAVASDKQSSGLRPACADHVNVELDEPLGDRDLIDASTGRPVEIR